MNALELYSIFASSNSDNLITFAKKDIFKVIYNSIKVLFWCSLTY